MATTGVINGTSLVVLIGTEVIAHATSCSLSVSSDLPDATTKDSGGWTDHIAGVKSWSLTTDGLATVEGTGTKYTVGDLFTALSGRTTLTVKFTTVTGATPVVGDLYWSGSAFVESLDMTADMESPVTFSAAFTGLGVLTQGTSA